MRVLLAEDDVDMLDVTAYALRKHGHDVTGVTNGDDALESWRKLQPEFVLLDINLPSRSGLDVCREIRKESTTPIIMVTALGDEDHIVQGFDCGADDYVSKPVSYRELAMRMRAILQRSAGAPIVDNSAVAKSGDLSVDLSAHEVRKGNKAVRMTRLEARILYFLLSNAGRTVPTERLIDLVWNYDGGDAFALKTHICHIRQKLEIAKGQPGYISSVPHVGYTLESA
jgi:DNA-binding response OmpR family regulator